MTGQGFTIKGSRVKVVWEIGEENAITELLGAFWRESCLRDVRYIGIQRGEIFGEWGLDGWETKPGLGVQVEGCHPEADRKALSLPLCRADHANEFANVAGKPPWIPMIPALMRCRFPDQSPTI